MVNSCCVASCRFKYSHNSTRSFHKFPLKDPIILEKWISFTGRTGWTPNKYSYICSAHFTDDSFKNKRKLGANLHLNPNAVPTLITPCQELSQKKDSEDVGISRGELPSTEPTNSEISLDEAGPSKRLRVEETSQISRNMKYVIKFVPHIINGEAKVVPVLMQDNIPADANQETAIPGPSSVNIVEAARKDTSQEIKSADHLEVISVVMNEERGDIEAVEHVNVEVEEQNEESEPDVDLLSIIDEEEEEELEIFNEEPIKTAVATMQKKCRICSNVADDMIDIFSDEGVEKKLLHKIKRCLPIKAPQQSDTLPLKLCFSCDQKLEYCDEFAQIAINSDQEFRMEDIKINLPIAPSDVEYISEEDGNPESSIESFDDNFDEDFKPEIIESESESDISDYEEEEAPMKTRRKTYNKKKVKKVTKKKKLKVQIKQSAKIEKIVEKCDQCDKTFKTKDKLVSHKLKIHSKQSKRKLDNNTTHSCKICNEIVQDLKKHYKSKHTESIPKFIHGKYTVKENIQCSLCTSVLKDNRDTKLHYFLYHQKYACEMCFELFPTSELQMEHSQQIHGIACKFCNVIFYCNNNLKIHHNNVHKNAKYPLKVKKSPSQLYECKTCNKGLLSKTNIKRHNYWCHKIYTCDFCLHECKTFNELDKHFIDDHGKKCYYCNKIFDNIDTLTLHIDYTHADYNPYCCEYCGIFFKNRNKLKLHRTSHVEDTDILYCNDCGQGFSTEKLLAFHCKYRHSVRTHLCGQCDKTFLTGYDLRKHLNIHKKKEVIVKQYPCTLCDQSLSSVRSLQRHMQTLHNKRAYVKLHKCDMCLETFTTKTNLNKHIKSIHNSILCYQCLICSQYYSTEENIISHVTIHKPDEIGNLKFSYIKIRPMICEFCNCYFSCKQALTKHIVNRHLVHKLKLKQPPRIAKLQQIFQYCKMKQLAKKSVVPMKKTSEIKSKK